MTKSILMFALSIIVSFSSLSAEDMKIKVVAKVNGHNITMDDIQIILASNPNMKYDKLPKATKQKVISRAIDKELLTRAIPKNMIEKTQEYKTALEVFRKNLIFNLWLKNESKNLKLSQSEIKKYYKENKDSFFIKASVKAKHILVEDKENAKAIIKKLKKSGNLKKDFIKMAKKESTGPSGKNGGELGWFEKDKMVPAFSKAAFKLKKNTMTLKPVKTRFGYHIIYVEKKKNGGMQKLSEVKEDISNILKADKFQKFVEAKTKKLRKKAKISILD